MDIEKGELLLAQMQLPGSSWQRFKRIYRFGNWARDNGKELLTLFLTQDSLIRGLKTKIKYLNEEHRGRKRQLWHKKSALEKAQSQIKDLKEKLDGN